MSYDKEVIVVKRYLLCASLVGILSVTNVSPFVTLHAATLWNSQKDDSKDKGGLYVPQFKGNKDGKNKLYNSQNKKTKSYGSKGLKENIADLARVERVKIVPSKLDSLVSASALKNRNDDLYSALSAEHETSKANAKYMINQLRENAKFNEKVRIDSEKERQEFRASPQAYKLARLKDYERKDKKMKALLFSKETEKMLIARKKTREKFKAFEDRRKEAEKIEAKALKRSRAVSAYTAGAKPQAAEKPKKKGWSLFNSWR